MRGPDMEAGGSRGGSGSARAAWLLTTLLLGGVLVSGWSGCSDSTGPKPANLPPVTYLSIQGTQLDTLSYRQVLHWWGSDPDGRVVGYLIRWDGEWPHPAEGQPWPNDTTWVFTTATQDTFSLPIAAPYGERTFEVRAVDDTGAADPVGRTQLFKLHDEPPAVSWASELPRNSFPVVSFRVAAEDPDGASTVHRVLCWLKPDSAGMPEPADTVEVRDPLIILDRSFYTGSTADISGPWTLSVQAVDDAGLRSAVIRHSWRVAQPKGDYLLIDQAPSNISFPSVDDRYWRRAMVALSPDTTVFDIEKWGGFHTTEEVLPFLRQFKGVLWYSGLQDLELGNDGRVAENLFRAESGLREYVNQGGRFLIAASNAIGTGGGLSDEFAGDLFGVSATYLDSLDSSNLPIGMPNGTIVMAGADSVRTTYGSVGTDYLIAKPEATPLFWEGPGFLGRIWPNHRITPDQSQADAVVGVMNTYGTGRAAVITFNLARANGLQNGNAVGAAIVRRLLGD